MAISIQAYNSRIKNATKDNLFLDDLKEISEGLIVVDLEGLDV